MQNPAMISLLPVKGHTHRCADCKHIIYEMLRRLYGEVKQDAKIPVHTRLSDYEGQRYLNDLSKIYRALQRHRGHTDFVRRKNLFRCDFHVLRDNFVVELDEKQHFSAARRISLLNYPRRLQLGFSLERWQSLCACINAKDFCHGIDGDGRGDPRSPGRAANLHETHLNREQLIEAIACGRPGTEMPHFDKYAYEDTDCYGLKGKDLGSEAPHSPHSTPLTRREIEAVADYIIVTFVGK